jgi:DNA-binding response OmpR family regulator
MAPVIPLSVVSSVSPGPGADVLLIDSSPEAASYAAILRATYRVSTTASLDVAKQFLFRHAPSLVVTELDLDGLDGVEICRAAKALPSAPPVLITTARTERVPDALAAGCDAVLLKPFAPNLLFARIGRLLRARSEMLRARTRQSLLKTSHLTERSESLLAGTNRVWPNTHCPYCDHTGVTGFEYSSHRKAWYACLECKKVWLAKRQE